MQVNVDMFQKHPPSVAVASLMNARMPNNACIRTSYIALYALIGETLKLEEFSMGKIET